ncbi:hypothetical protein HME9302_01087 [Alteripontixanthobacter maritimus]|uniref:Lipoprotein n=1 Tax=Alteripontixanthobacter maritimus TaxID=2161824 RepID=A0A369Q631_9SPHN|nr:hypothetical protein [Alteripontixanthobacter maritimus]RDC59890.1 hypothetical protein HME9302_01087 [Alteripontixanthobacter maritimus]
MRKSFLLVLLAAPMALAGCGGEPSAEEQAAIDAAALAEIEAASVVPAAPLNLQPILYPDIEKNELYGASCAFAPGGSFGAVALAMEDAGYLKYEDTVQLLAPDAGSAEGPLGSREKYDGREYSFRLERTTADSESAGMDSVDYRARLVVRDGQDRIVYEQDGNAQCGA